MRGLAGIGLLDLATTHPSDLLRIVAGHRPSSNDPSGWWGEFTAGQGLSESADEELRKAIGADGPKGLAHTIATYVRLFKDATDAQKVLRDALFTTILETAQRIAGPTFDTARLPGGARFVLLSQNSGDWPHVAEAMKSGNGLLAVFRQMEDARQDRRARAVAPVAPVELHYYIAFADAQNDGRSVEEYEPNGKAAEEIGQSSIGRCEFYLIHVSAGKRIHDDTATEVAAWP